MRPFANLWVPSSPPLQELRCSHVLFTRGHSQHLLSRGSEESPRAEIQRTHSALKGSLRLLHACVLSCPQVSLLRIQERVWFCMDNRDSGLVQSSLSSESTGGGSGPSDVTEDGDGRAGKPERPPELLSASGCCEPESSHSMSCRSRPALSGR